MPGCLPRYAIITLSCPRFAYRSASVSDLQSRLSSVRRRAVTALNFRPNLVLRTSTPFVEDTWHSLGLRFDNGQRADSQGLGVERWQPCSRCRSVNIDTTTGKADEHNEPLATLATYRREGSQVYFGVLFSVSNTAEQPSISVGQEFRVLAER